MLLSSTIARRRHCRYATFCGLAGVDPRDTVYLQGGLRDIDGVDVWPMLIGKNTTQPRALTPTTEASIIDAADPTRWWKLITLAGQSNYYLPNQTNIPGTDPCLAGTHAQLASCHAENHGVACCCGVL